MYVSVIWFEAGFVGCGSVKNTFGRHTFFFFASLLTGGTHSGSVSTLFCIQAMMAMISAPQPTTAPMSSFREFPQRSVPVIR